MSNSQNKGFKAGTVSDPSDSMAQAIDDAFRTEWSRRGLPLPDIGAEDRLLLFCAIAQGVIRHLVEKSGEAFKFYVLADQVVGQNETGEKEGELITSDNPEEIEVTTDFGYYYGGWYRIEKNEAVVQQHEDKKVVSEGRPEIVEVNYKGDLYGVS
jgi:hypothetical protein